MANLIPEKLVNFRVFAGPASAEQLALTDVELPKFEALTETIKGAGIAGEYDSPVIGHFKSMSAKLKYRVPLAQNLALLAAVAQSLQLYGAVQQYDASGNVLSISQLRISITGETKSFEPGKFEPGKPTEASCEIEIAYIKISVDGVTIVELDKLNMKFAINGVDYLQATRVALGGA